MIPNLIGMVLLHAGVVYQDTFCEKMSLNRCALYAIH